MPLKTPLQAYDVKIMIGRHRKLKSNKEREESQKKKREREREEKVKKQQTNIFCTLMCRQRGWVTQAEMYKYINKEIKTNLHSKLKNQKYRFECLKSKGV